MASTALDAFSSELRLLTYCGRSEQSLRRRQLVRTAISDSICWSRFVGLTRRHRAVPQAWEVLRHDAPDLVPQEVMDGLQHAYLANSQRNLWLAGQLGEIVRRFTAAKIAVVGLKGPVLATRFYGQLAARQFRDLDILIRPGDLNEAAKILTQMNYEGPGTQVVQMHPSKGRLFRQFYKDLAFYRDRENQRAVIELHWRLTCTQKCFPISRRKLWRQTDHVLIGGTPVRCMPAPESIVYIAYDGGMNGWSQLRWLFDLARAIDHPDAADRDALFAAAVRLRAERQLAMGCWILHELQILDDLPSVLSAYLARRTRLGAMAATVYQAIRDENSRHNQVVRAAPWTYRLSRSAKWFAGQIAAGLAPHPEDVARMGWLAASERQFQRAARKWVRWIPNNSPITHPRQNNMTDTISMEPPPSSATSPAPPPSSNRRAA